MSPESLKAGSPIGTELPRFSAGPLFWVNCRYELFQMSSSARLFFRRQGKSAVEVALKEAHLFGPHYAKRRVFLRNLLQQVPFWTRGHLLLGFTELELIRLSHAKPEPRTLLAVELASAAAQKLLQNRGERENAPSALGLESLFLTGMLAFLKKDFSVALENFQRILLPENSVLVGEELYFKALENAAAAAMALGEKAQALELYRLLPQNRLTGEAATALDYLTAADAPTPYSQCATSAPSPKAAP